MISLKLCLLFMLCYFEVTRQQIDNIGISIPKWDDLKQDDSLPPSVTKWKPLSELSENKNMLTILSMYVHKHHEGTWYIPSRYRKYSAGWNRSVTKSFSLNQPGACNIQLFGLVLESEFEDYLAGGTGYLRFQKKGDNVKIGNYGSNSTLNFNCYYMSNKDFGSEFLDTPKTLGVAISCPINLDAEIGPYDPNEYMVPGKVCRTLLQYETQFEIILLPSDYSEAHSASTFQKYLLNKYLNDEENQINLKTLFTTSPQSKRTMKSYQLLLEQQKQFKEFHIDHQSSNFLTTNHAVCCVQTFRNSQTGHLLYLFVVHYTMLGYKVIVYDRFGYHFEYIKELLKLFPHTFYYHHYTALQLVVPDKYNEKYFKEVGFEAKYFYKFEKKTGHSSAKAADTPDQDSDKAKTYDHCRVEYSHLDSIMFIDSDEYMYCPYAQPDYEDPQTLLHAQREKERFEYLTKWLRTKTNSSSSSSSPPPPHSIHNNNKENKFSSSFIGANLDQQRQFQQAIMTQYHSYGVEEMRMVRLPYSGRVPLEIIQEMKNNKQSSQHMDLTESTGQCMAAMYENTNFNSSQSILQSVSEMFACWSFLSSYDRFPKSSDLSGKCPFHYNHWSCDGLKSGGRSKGLGRCRCKVSHDLFNYYDYRPYPSRCHLIHLNDNGYRFRSKESRPIGANDRGNISYYNPLYLLYRDYRSTHTDINDIKDILQQPVVNKKGNDDKYAVKSDKKAPSNSEEGDGSDNSVIEKYLMEQQRAKPKRKQKKRKINKRKGSRNGG